MKSRVFGIIAVALILFISITVAVWFYLPKIIVNSVTSDSGIQVIPVEAKETINEAVDELPKALKTNKTGITLADIIEVIDKSTSDEIIETINQLESTDLKNQKQVMDIITSHINLYKLNNEKTKNMMLERMKMADVHNILKMIRENGKPYLVTIPIAKETIKGILKEKQKQIESELNS